MRHIVLAAALAIIALPAAAQQCGGNFQTFLSQVQSGAQSRGLAPQATQAFLSGARQNQSVLQADRSQGIFTVPFVEFARRLISNDRVNMGARMSSQYNSTFNAIESQLGVPRGILLAFWGFETDYGRVQGDYNTRDALLTLAHDCRRPELFLPQVYAAIELTGEGGMDPATTTGAWAGEIGQVQMLPEDILRNGRDGDGDGRVLLKQSAPDALVSAATMLRDLGWRPNQPWLQEVTVPSNFDWSLTGLDQPRAVSDWAQRGVAPRSGSLARVDNAALILPQGRTGPAFLAYPNYRTLFEWNESFVYVTTAAYFATRLEGAPVFDASNAPSGLSQSQMVDLQRRLSARGYDVGGVDGILGEMTRAAVQAEQERLGLPADAWPTVQLLQAL